ncbi:hypothetical protein Bca101_031052 [Brassica carinata]
MLVFTESNESVDLNRCIGTRCGEYTRLVHEVQTRPILTTPGRWCLTDGSWKDKDLFSGQDWFSTLPGFDGLLEARNNLRQFQATFATDYSQLVKMVSEPKEWPAFESYLEDIKLLRKILLNSEIVHVPRTKNLRVDSLACSARKQMSFVVHMDGKLPIWFIELT